MSGILQQSSYDVNGPRIPKYGDTGVRIEPLLSKRERSVETYNLGTSSAKQT